MKRQKVTPFLWYIDQAEEAANYYVSIIKDSRILSVTPGPNGKALTVEFSLAGNNFIALNGGPMFQLTEAISLSVDCEDQAEIDELWEKLSAGGTPGRCGWLKDRYGLSWQIVPSALGQLMQSSDPVKQQRVMAAFMQMTKFDLQKLLEAANGA